MKKTLESAGFPQKACDFQAVVFPEGRVEDLVAEELGRRVPRLQGIVLRLF